MRLREGTELLGHYEGTAYEQPTYLVRRGDGQVIHVSHLLYQVALLMDGREPGDIAALMSAQLGRQVVPANVEYLIENKLRPLGLVAGDDDHPTRGLTRSEPLLALRWRTRVIPPRLHRGVTTALQPLFWPPVVLFVLGGLVAANVWVFGAHRAELSRAVRQLPFHPDLLLLVTAMVLFSGFFHELGHATATRYGGGAPGAMGVGVYLAWPAFFTDLTDSYRLDRRGRLRSDLGGVYFNAVLIVAAGVAALTTGFAPLLVFMVLSQAMALYQFLPFVRLDGYYIMSDLVGVPNLFEYLGPVLRSVVRRPDPLTVARLQRLKPRARVAITAWSVVTVLFLVINFGAIAVLAPVILPAEWAAVHVQLHAIDVAVSRDDVVVAVNDVLNLVFVAIAPAGLLLIFGMLLRRALRGIRKWWATRPVVAGSLGVVMAAALLFQGQALVTRFAAGPGPAPKAAHAAAAAAARPDRPLGPRAHSTVVPPVPSAGFAPVVAASSAPVRFYVVQPGDTLSGIAARCLGDASQWPAVYDLNVGRPQPGGQDLVQPDLILPGWTLEVPGSEPAAATLVPTAAATSVTSATTAVLVRPAAAAPPPATGNGGVVVGGTPLASTAPVAGTSGAGVPPPVGAGGTAAAAPASTSSPPRPSADLPTSSADSACAGGSRGCAAPSSAGSGGVGGLAPATAASPAVAVPRSPAVPGWSNDTIPTPPEQAGGGTPAGVPGAPALAPATNVPDQRSPPRAGRAAAAAALAVGG